jgi:molybdopterin-guanine dinucleotide biosynthesis protein A
MSTIGILPASGKASRVGGIPKFCLPISDERSLLQWHVEQMLEVCDEVRVSTRAEGSNYPKHGYEYC